MRWDYYKCRETRVQGLRGNAGTSVSKMPREECGIKVLGWGDRDPQDQAKPVRKLLYEDLAKPAPCTRSPTVV